MCPLGYGEIHTSCQAGGIASDLIRSISSASVIRFPAWSRKTQPEPALRREKPGEFGETVLSRGMRGMFPEVPPACCLVRHMARGTSYVLAAMATTTYDVRAGRPT